MHSAWSYLAELRTRVFRSLYARSLAEPYLMLVFQQTVVLLEVTRGFLNELWSSLLLSISAHGDADVKIARELY